MHKASFILVLMLPLSVVDAAQCMVDGKWYPYSHPACSGNTSGSSAGAPQAGEGKRSTGSSIGGTPIEKDAMISDVTAGQIDALASIVRMNGYRCDSVSSAIPFVWRGGYNLTCNGFRYSFELEDKGGR